MSPSACSRYTFSLLLLSILVLFTLDYLFMRLDPAKSLHPPPPPAPDLSSPPPPVDPELVNLMKVIEWPIPPVSPTNFSLSTSPNNCEYHVLNKQATYQVGDHLQIVIVARDYSGQPKSYGGDFFLAKLHSLKLKAGVSGHITDHRNGTYTATFLLPWPGSVEVAVRLIHSSEAVAVLQKKRDTRPDKVYFNGYFQYNGSTEVTECNVELPGRDVCEYTDPVSRLTWQCTRPRQKPCDSLLYHSMGGYRKVTDKTEEDLLSNRVTNKDIPGNVKPILVLLKEGNQTLTSRLPRCTPGQEPPNPSGYYYNDVWTSLVCSGDHFPQPADARACLRGKDIHMFGDSTLRQWFEYLEMFIPTLKRIDLHVTYQSGPILATDADAGLVMRWRAHGLPLRTSKTQIADLHYEASHIEGISGGPQTVVVLTAWAHFTTFPVSVYIKRIQILRKALVRLLQRSPNTTVLIKSANTGYKSVYGSDWLSLQLDSLLREMLRGTGVTVLDVWGMTSCHYVPDNIHPARVIVRNEVDLMLSYICPR